jgi:hypothetical protein
MLLQKDLILAGPQARQCRRFLCKHSLLFFRRRTVLSSSATVLSQDNESSKSQPSIQVELRTVLLGTHGQG